MSGDEGKSFQRPYFLHDSLTMGNFWISGALPIPIVCQRAGQRHHRQDMSRRTATIRNNPWYG